MGFFREILDQFGHEAMMSLKGWSSCMEKLAALRNQRIFLLRCRGEGVLPDHLNNHFKCTFTCLTSRHPFVGKFQRTIQSFNKKILSLEIKIVNFQINSIEKHVKFCTEKASQLLPIELYHSFEGTLNSKYNHVFNANKCRLLGKLDRLRNQQLTNNFGQKTSDNNWLINTTSTKLPDNVQRILELGPKFSITNNLSEIPTLKLLADVEYCIDLNPDITDKECVRAQSTNIITNHLQKMKHSNPTGGFLKKEYNEARSFLKNNPNLLVIPSDKGNTTAIIEKTEYEQKMCTLIDDDETYKKLTKDPTNKYQTENNKLVNMLKEKEFVDERTSKILKTNNALAPRIYGLPKLHKNGRPLRPIVSCIGSPGYGMSRFLNSILSNLIPEFRFNVRNSFEVVERLKNHTIPAGYSLVSLDVKSLFTNIPRDLVIQVIDSSWSSISEHTPIDKDTFMQLINFTFNSSFFSYKGNYFKQTFGMPMGDPLSPILANLVMNYVANSAINRLDFHPPFLFIYVDDTLTAIPTDKLNHSLQVFNSVNPKLQFTTEVESNNRIPFLDITVINNNGTILCDLYKKPTSSNRILNYKSNHPIHQKINVIRQCKHKILTLSDKQFWNKNFAELRKMLRLNSYPNSLINNILSSSQSRTQEKSPTNVPNRKFFKIPYVKNLSECLSKKLSSKNTQIAFYNTKTVRNLFSKIKDPIPLTQQRDVIYKVPCTNCHCSYIGQTTQHLQKRLAQHKRDCNITNIDNPKSGLAIHHFSEGHNFEFSKVEVLDKETNLKKRLFLEMAHIQKNPNTVNLNTDTQNLNIVYNNLIKNF